MSKPTPMKDLNDWYKAGNEYYPEFERLVKAYGAAEYDRGLSEAITLIANDANSITFQTMGKYRTALIAALRSMKGTP
jgi:hypothetical protein